MYRAEERCIQGFGGETDHLEDPGIQEENIKMDLQEVGLGGGMDWIDLAQDMDRWRALINAVMNLWVS